MSFGKKIKELREKQMLSQQDLANRINSICATQLKRNTISNYERGKSFPDQDKLKALVNILETTSDALLGLQTKSPNSKLSENDGNYISEVKAKGSNKNLIPLVRGSSPSLREYRYISAEMHNHYSEKCNDISFINGLPTMKIPCYEDNDMRAFQLSKCHQCRLKKWEFGNGDVLIGEVGNTENLDISTPFFIIVWKHFGLKIIRHHELVQLMDLPELVEVWIPKVLIRYNVNSSQICSNGDEEADEIFFDQ